MYTSCATSWSIDHFQAFLDLDENGTPSYENMLETIYQARNFSKILTSYLQTYTDYSGDPLNNVQRVKYLTAKIAACFAKPDNMSDTDYRHIIATYFTEPTNRKIKEWFTLEGDVNTKHFLDHDEQGRDNIFFICFALGLSYHESKDFFEKVFLDRFFVKRPKDVIFHYCLKNSLPFSSVLRLSQKLQHDAQPNAETKQTKFIEKQVLTETITEEEMLAIANELMSSNETKQKDTIANAILALKNDIFTLLANDSTHTYQVDNEKVDCGRGGDEDIYYRIMLELSKEDKSKLTISNARKTLTSFEAVDYVRIYLYKSLPKLEHIKTKDLMNGNYNFYTMRNTYILLKFYKFWYTKNLQNYHYDPDHIEIFKEELNGMLLDLGLPTLYACNPYDLLFLLAAEGASSGTNPIYLFQNIIESILNLDDADTEDA